MAGAGVVLAAISFTCCSTSIFLRVSEITPKELNNAASSVELIVTNIGIFVAPYFMSMIGSFMGNSESDTMLKVCAVILIAMAVVMIVGGLFYRTKTTQQEA